MEGAISCCVSQDKMKPRAILRDVFHYMDGDAFQATEHKVLHHDELVDADGHVRRRCVHVDRSVDR